ncbi:carnosine N-methyltransferase-like isoform X2 [Branchiostoma lanceolatum]|uniref:carnosine N-methyltransferase-like isoform X2 n=1 Tax=Branchiostoma lanceolatum TaxID=7740 RepID=UPI0034555D36
MATGGKIRKLGKETRRQNEEERLEQEHFFRVISAFRHYRTHSMQRLDKAEKCFHQLPPYQQKLLPNHTAHLAELRTCVDQNYDFLLNIIKMTDNMFENKDYTGNGDVCSDNTCCQKHRSSESTLPLPREFDMDKVKTTLKQFVRDWSAEGKVERDACYKPIIDEIQQRFPADQWCEGLNSITLHPWIHQFCNNRSSGDQTRPVAIPDIDPHSLPQVGNFSMTAGDFLEVYTEQETWDCVATCYFIDTAHNIVSYVETIHNILKPGGYWINLGPLLYHFADITSEASIELSYEDLRSVIQEFGFEILKEDTKRPTMYIQNTKSMLQYEYDCVYFVARKPLEVANNHTNHSQDV